MPENETNGKRISTCMKTITKVRDRLEKLNDNARIVCPDQGGRQKWLKRCVCVCVCTFMLLFFLD